MLTRLLTLFDIRSRAVVRAEERAALARRLIDRAQQLRLSVIRGMRSMRCAEMRERVGIARGLEAEAAAMMGAS